MTQDQINDLYTIMHRLDKAARLANLPYWMAAGTALGAVRHGGLIPWDDDADVYMLEPQWDAAAMNFFHAANQQGLHVRPHINDGIDSTAWYKVYLGERVFPNCDIFLMNYDTKDQCWKFSDHYAREWWPNEKLYNSELQTSRRVPFGPLNLPLFGSPEDYLVRTYGADWKVVVKDGWDHMNEKPRPENARALTVYSAALPTIRF